MKDLIKSELVKVEMALKYAQKRLQNLPEGSLQVKNERGSLKYIRYLPSSSCSNVYINNDQKMIAALEEKGYLEKLQKAALQQKADLLKMEKLNEKKRDYEKVFLEIPREKRHLIKPYIEPETCMNPIALDRWMEKPRRSKIVMTEGLVTKNGEKVRSKSELIIADRLYYEGIPYHYEAPLMLADENLGQFFDWFPDFKVLNKRTGREYYWEHFGRMDDSEYFSSFELKMEQYAKNGIFPGEKLIVTMETSKQALSTEYVDILIKKYLL